MECVPEEREDQIVFTKQKIGTFKIDNMTQWLAAFHILLQFFVKGILVVSLIGQNFFHDFLAYRLDRSDRSDIFGFCNIPRY
jgi:hypothetical protein